MHRLYSVSIAFLLGAILTAILFLPARAQEQFQFESDLTAKRRVFDSVVAGFRAIRRGPNGNYYILTPPASSALLYDSTGKRVGPIPSESPTANTVTSLVSCEAF